MTGDYSILRGFYRKKPVGIEAWNWNGSDQEAAALAEWSEGQIEHIKEPNGWDNAASTRLKERCTPYPAIGSSRASRASSTHASPTSSRQRMNQPDESAGKSTICGDTFRIDLNGPMKKVGEDDWAYVGAIGRYRPQIIPSVGDRVTVIDNEDQVYDAIVEEVLPGRAYFRPIWATQRHPGLNLTVNYG